MKYIFQILRKFSFWSLDYLKGRPIRKHLNDIAFILENYGSEESNSRRAEHLQKVLEHAHSTVPYYMKHNKSNQFKDFQIINKGTIIDHYDSFISSDFLGQKNTSVVTSGSTGVPFKLFHNQTKRYRNSADVIYFAKQGGYEIGSRLFFIKVWNEINRKSPLKLWMENIRPYSVFNYADEDIKKLLQELKKDKSQKSIVIFASACNAIVNYLDSIKAKPKNLKVISIITNSDSLDNYTKKRMEYYFKVPVISRYSNMECGILAQQNRIGGFGFDINWASFHIELVHPEKDEPVELGEMGRVIVTDLFNYCMPLIRYDTGDLAYMEKSERNGTPVLKSIEGRKIDLIRDTSNKVITSHIINVNMWKYNELRQFQFVQKDSKEYLFRLNLRSSPFSREQELLKEFKGYLGNDANIKIEYVDEIPPLSSGKRKFVVNEMDKTK